MDEGLNIGSIIAAGMLGVQIILTGVLMFLRRNPMKNLDAIEDQDCLLFDRRTVAIELYSIDSPRRKSVMRNESIRPTSEMNTSRHLKEDNIVSEKPPKDLKLKENNISEMDSVEGANKTVDINFKQEGGDGNDIKIHNNFVKPQPEELPQTENPTIGGVDTQIPNAVRETNSKSITIKDYESFDLRELILHDSRSFITYFWNTLVRRNLILSVFCKHSILDPVYLRIAKLTFWINLSVGLSAYIFSDKYIERRLTSPKKVTSIFNNSIILYQH
jgi:hypothetical protein